MITIDVCGTPRPQGSMKLFRAKSGHAVAKYADTVYEWRALITTGVRAAHDGPPIDGAVAIALSFTLDRPRSHFGTGRNAGTLKPSAPAYPSNAPDLDKLVRAVLDGITDAGTVWHDDGQVVQLATSKRYAIDGSVPGVTIRACRAIADCPPSPTS